MEVRITLPEEVANLLEKPAERSALELITVGLYRDGRLTRRQAAEFLGIAFSDMAGVLEKHNAYVAYGEEELDEDMAHVGDSQ